MTSPSDIPKRIHAVLKVDGIPERRRAAHLRDRCGVSIATARRMLHLSGALSPRPVTILKLVRGLDVDWEWLWRGTLARWHPRTFRVYIEGIKGYPPEDASRMVRLMTGYVAGHMQSSNLFMLVSNGNMSLRNAARFL